MAYYGRDSWDSGYDPVDGPRIDKAVMLGLCGSCALVLLGALLGGDILRFISIEGLLLVVGGTVASTLVQFSTHDIQVALEAARSVLFVQQGSPGERLSYLVQLSRRVKDEGVLMLEHEAAATSDPFLRLGLDITVDGQHPDDIRRILENEMRASNERAWRSVQVWETMGNFAPAMGLIGTLIGLIQMLGSLDNAATVGPAMSLALVATLYGSIAANLFFFPMAGKLKLDATRRAHIKEITLEGLMSVARSESPIVLEQRLQSFSALAANG